MKEKINLQELTALLSEKAGITKKEADVFLREFFGLMTDALIEDKIVKIRNLGTFKLSEVEARESVDVRNGNRVVIPAHTKVAFTQDKELSEIINKPYQHLEPQIVEEVPSPEETPQKEETPPKEEIVQLVEDAPQTDNFQVETYNNELADEEILKRRRRIYTFISTLLIVAALIVIFYYLSKENVDSISHYPRPTKTAYDIAKEKEDNTKDNTEFEKTGEIVNPVDTTTPPLKKETWEPGKRRKTKVGERLTMISFEEYGDVAFWIYIYDENKHLIDKNIYVKAGVELIIPPPEKYDIDAKSSKSLQKARDFSNNYNNSGHSK